MGPRTPNDATIATRRRRVAVRRHSRARLLRAVAELSKAFALAVPHEEALRIRDDVGFFQAVRSVLAKGDPGERKSDEELDHAIRQIVLGEGRRRAREAGPLDPLRGVSRGSKR